MKSPSPRMLFTEGLGSKVSHTNPDLCLEIAAQLTFARTPM